MTAQPVKSRNDPKEYRLIELCNGLRALLISDTPKNDDDDADNNTGKSKSQKKRVGIRNKNSEDNVMQAAAALCIKTGGLMDPDDVPGLAHYLEHMVFMGSKKYPKPNEWDVFVKGHGGNSNARTDLESTIFYFDIQSNFFKEALDRFAQFFINPLFKPECMRNEAEIVDREWRESLYRERSRIEQLVATMAREGHPMRKFTWGNYETLREKPERDSVDVSKRLREYFHSYYLAQHMSLVILSNETLDELQRWVTDIFHHIRGNYEPQPTLAHFGKPFDTPEFTRLYKVIPVKNIRQVLMCWALPSLRHHYKSRPSTYLGFLLGHEGRGSLLSALKRKNYGLNIYCGTREEQTDQEHNSTWCCFSIHISVTEEGLENVDDVISCVFQYLRMMKEQGPKRLFWEEVYTVEKNEFNYMEPQDPADFVMNMAQNMHKYERQDYITAHYIQMLEYDEELIRQCLHELKPDNFNLILMSQKYAHDSSCNLQEYWYRTRYGVEDVPAEWREKWSKVRRDNDMHYPEPNKFIARDFALKEMDVDQRDKLVEPLVRCNVCELWHHMDEDFLVPRSFVSFYMKSVHATNEPASKVMMDMYVRLLVTRLSEVAYPAEMARLSYSVQSLDYGIAVRVSGFSDKVPKLFRKIVKEIRDCRVDTDLFECIKKELNLSYLNLSISPQRLTRDLCQAILRNDFWLAMQKRQILRHITESSLIDYIHHFYSGVYIEGLAQGNILAEQAVELREYLIDNLYVSYPDDHQLHDSATQVTQIPCGDAVLCVRNINPSDENSVLHNYYQHEHKATLRDHMLNELLLMYMEEPCFYILRTKYKLAYNPHSDKRCLHDVIGFSVTVVSSANLTLKTIDEYVEKFLEEFNEKVQKLSDDDFEELKKTSRSHKQCEDTSLKDEVERHWREIIKHSYRFEEHQSEIAEIEDITLDEFKQWAKDHLMPSEKRRKLSIQVVGNAGGLQGERAVAVSDVEDKLQPVSQPYDRNSTVIIDNIDRFRRSCSAYEVNMFTSVELQPGDDED